MDACGSTPSGLRDRLAILLMWVTGMKPGELLALKPDDLRPAAVRLQGGREVVIPKPHRREVAALSRRWMRHRSQLDGVRSDQRRPLICSLAGGRLDQTYLRRGLPRLAERAKVTRRFHAQGLRQTFATALYMSDVPVEIIRRQLGHSDVAFTTSYLERICPKKVIRAMETFTLG